MICFNKLLVVHIIVLVANTVNTVEGVSEGNKTSDIDTSCKAVPSDEKLWGLVELHNGKELRSFDAFTSPDELCKSYLGQHNMSDDNDNNNDDEAPRSIGNGKKIENCINLAQQAVGGLRCVVIDTNDNSSSVFGVDRYSTFWKIAERLVWDRIAVILLVIILMTYYQVGNNQNWQYTLLLNVVFSIISAYVDAGWNHYGDGKWFSHMDVRTIARESFVAFRAVHPVDNVAVCLSHFLTYWIHAAQWIAKTPRQFFIWALLTDVISPLVNEWTHHDEWKTDVRCTRVAFIAGMKEHGYDNLWREFLFGPFFVYFYLLPKFIIHWTIELMA